VGPGYASARRCCFDAFARVLAAAENIGCFGVVVDAKREAAEQFYHKYDFTTVDESRWPRKMFIAMATVRQMFDT
jgi:hypothetical protein